MHVAGPPPKESRAHLQSVPASWQVLALQMRVHWLLKQQAVET